MIFDVAGPLAAYSVLRSAGLTAVTALMLSGVLPALGVTIGVIWHRRLDAVGVVVLAGTHPTGRLARRLTFGLAMSSY